MNRLPDAPAPGLRYASPLGVVPPFGRYSHVVSVPAGHRLLVLAGQTGHAPDGRLPDSFAAQFRNAIANVVTILAAEGAGPGSIVKLNTFALQVPFDTRVLAEVRREFLGDVMPPATFVYVPALYLPGMFVEVEAWAAVAP